MITGPLLAKHAYRLPIRLLCAATLVCAALLLLAAPLARALLPLCASTLNLIQPDFSHVLTLGEYQGNAAILLNATLEHPRLIDAFQFVPQGAQFSARTHLPHFVLPLVILFTGLCAWPTPTWAYRGALLFAGIVIGVVVTILTTPFLLAGQIEIAFQELFEQSQVELPTTPTLAWMLFTESGGRWLLPLLGVIASGAAHDWFYARR